MSFEDDLNAPVERDTFNVDALLNGTLYRLRFTAMDGLAWARECDKYPMHADAEGRFDHFQLAYGYDIRALTIGTAPLCGVRVDGDDLIPLTDGQWTALFAHIDGLTFKRISDAIFGLNDRFPQQAVEDAKKLLAASVRPSKRASSSASPRGGSSGGSRKRPQSSSTTVTDESSAA